MFLKYKTLQGKGDFDMLNKTMWKIFKGIGSIEAYLYYRLSSSQTGACKSSQRDLANLQREKQEQVFEN